MSQGTVVFLNVSMETQTERGELGPWKDWVLSLWRHWWQPKIVECMMTKYFLERGAAARHINKGHVVGACTLNQGGIYTWQYYWWCKQRSQTEVSGTWKPFIDSLSWALYWITNLCIQLKKTNFKIQLGLCFYCDIMENNQFWNINLHSAFISVSWSWKPSTWLLTEIRTSFITAFRVSPWKSYWIEFLTLMQDHLL